MLPSVDPMTSRTDDGVVAVGTAEPPEVLASTLPVAIVARPMFPLDVTGPPVRPLFVPTEVTVPVPVTVVQEGFAAAPPVDRTWPDVPGARTDHVDAPRYSTSPCVEPIALSMTMDSEFASGVDDPPEIFDTTVLLPIEGNCARVADPEIAENEGCVDDGTPEVEIWLIHWFDTAA